jgi:hypothetical protein
MEKVWLWMGGVGCCLFHVVVVVACGDSEGEYQKHLLGTGLCWGDWNVCEVFCLSSPIDLVDMEMGK